MAWLGVITNNGNDLLRRWVQGKTLNITRAASGQGRVEEVTMLAQTGLVNEKQTVSIVSNEPVDGGQRIKLQVTPQLAVGYPINQFGIWASLEDEEEKMIALFQTDTDIGIDIPSRDEMPDFIYTFYGLLAFHNQGTLVVNMDASAVVSEQSMNRAIADAVAAHNTSTDDPHDGVLAKAVHSHTNADITYPDDNTPANIFRLGVEGGKLYIQEVQEVTE